MKAKILVFLICFSILKLYSVNRYVDPSLSQGDGSTFFTNITNAVNASVNGDKILVASGTYNESTININKSISIQPENSGVVIKLNSDINIQGFKNMNFEIIGFNLGVKNITSTTTSSTVERAKVTIIDCSMTNIDLNKDGFDVNIIHSTISNKLDFRFGTVIRSTMQNLFLWDENGMDVDNNKIKIIGNDISNETQLINDNYVVLLANNNLKNIRIQKWVLNTSKINYIINNNFSEGAEIHFAVYYITTFYSNVSNWAETYKIPSYNFIFDNNLFGSSYYFTKQNTSPSEGYKVFVYGSDYNLLILERSDRAPIFSSTSTWPNFYSNGFFEFSYNKVPNMRRNDPLINLSFSNDYGSINPIDGGNPKHEFYDIDLTINDRGINGGPFSRLNYEASNPNNSKAFIYYLEMPTDLFSGQDVEIMAKGYIGN